MKTIQSHINTVPLTIFKSYILPISFNLTLFQSIGGLAKRALRARARYLNVNLARRNRDLQTGGKEIESLEEKSDSL